MCDEEITLKELLEERKRAHDDQHKAHEESHKTEHQLNKEAIREAAGTIDKAVTAAKDTVRESFIRVDGRINQLDKDMSDLKINARDMFRVSESNSKDIKSIQEALLWIVRIMIGGIVLALMTLIFRPGLV